MAQEAMLAKAPIDPKQVHRIKSEKRNAAEAAVQYEDDLRASFWIGLQTSCLVSISCSRDGARRGTQLLSFPAQRD